MYESCEAGALAASLIDEHPGRTGLALQVLNALQHEYGYLPEDGLSALADATERQLEEIVEFAGFFSGYTLQPTGRFLVEVCDGTACHARGSMRLLGKLEMLFGIREGGTTPDGLVTLRSVGCVGSCSSAPVVVVAGEPRGHMRISRLSDLVREVAER